MTPSQPSLSWYPVSDTIKALLVSAADSWENDAESAQYMHQALAQPDVDLDVLVAAYRYFFYKTNNQMALRMARQVLERVTIAEQFPNTWEELAPILAARKEDPIIRLYLNAYSASGLVLARLGDLETAKEISARVNAIDDRHEFGASVVLDILTKPDDDDDD